MEEKPDFGATTAIVVYVKKHITPKVLWSVIGVLVAALGSSITWLVHTQSTISLLQDQGAEFKKTLAEIQKVLNEMNTTVAVLNKTSTIIEGEVADQQKWRQDIEREAEAPPHARRRPAK